MICFILNELYYKKQHLNQFHLQYSYIFEDKEDEETVEPENKSDEKSEKSDETSEKSQKSLPADMVRF